MEQAACEEGGDEVVGRRRRWTEGGGTRVEVLPGRDRRRRRQGGVRRWIDRTSRSPSVTGAQGAGRGRRAGWRRRTGCRCRGEGTPAPDLRLPGFGRTGGRGRGGSVGSEARWSGVHRPPERMGVARGAMGAVSRGRAGSAPGTAGSVAGQPKRSRGRQGPGRPPT